VRPSFLRITQPRVAVALTLIIVAIAAASARAADKDDSKSPWGRMDYGPFLSHTIMASKPADNVTLKGVAVKLDGGNAGYLFDTQLLRPSAAWTGKFLNLKGVVFNGDHGPNPSVAGDIAFATRNTPGWAKPGTADFTDPRPEKLGPLPHDWLRYRGLYKHGDDVVFSYRVGQIEVLESPGLLNGEGNPVFTRTFRIGPSKQPLTVLVAELDRASVRVPSEDGRDLAKLAGATAAASSVVILSDAERSLSCAVKGAPAGSVWTGQEGQAARLALSIAPHEMPVTLTLGCSAISRVGLANVETWGRFLTAGSKPVDFDVLTKGGPARYADTVVTQGKLGDADPKSQDAAYVVDTLTVPEQNPYHSWMRFGGFDFFPDGKSAAICTWSGDVWIVSGIDDKLEKLTWRRYASGLFQALGLKIVNGDVYVHGRDQITRLKDLNGDGEADFYECFNNDVAITSGFHEFAFDLQTDPQGNFYFIKAGPVMPGGGGFQRIGPNNGTMMKVTPDGEHLSVVATGFRAPNGMGVGPNGEITSGDNEGTWTPVCRLNWIKPGGFYGVVDLAHRDPPPTSTDNPLCWFPKSWDNSSGGQAWVTSDKWGPFAGDLLHLSYGTCKLYKVLKEEVDGQVQGGVVAFPLNFDSGIMRARFNPADGQLYVCGLRGWQTSAAKDACLQRVRYTGKSVTMPKAMHVKANGIELTFTTDLDPEIASDAGSYGVERWSYRWTSGYGSGEYKVSDPNKEGHDTLTVKSAKLAPDKRTVFIEIAEGIVPCMQMLLTCNLETADGKEFKTPIAMTVNTVGDGKRLMISKEKPSGEVK
jgi:hypothetical protein